MGQCESAPLISDHDRYTRRQQTLIIGTSLVKHVNRCVAQDIHVVCVHGGHIPDIQAELGKIGAAKLEEYNKIIVQVGSNDLADLVENTENTEHTEKSTVDIAKGVEELLQGLQRGRKDDLEITVSGILPRMNNGEYNRKMQPMNEMLSALCGQLSVRFVDNAPRFVLQCGDIDDSVYEDDVHVGMKGTHRLLSGWGVPLKQSANRSGHMTLKNTVKCKPQQAWNTVEKIIAGIPAEIRDKVMQIEKKNNGVWLITMDDQASYECLVESGVVLEGQVVKCYDVAQKLRPLKKVMLSEVPYQVTEEWLSARLSGYGRVEAMRRKCHEGTSIHNGVIEVDMSVDINIPKTFQVASNVVIGVGYDGQREECRNCGSLGHFTSRCPKPRPCYICKSLDHKAIECPHAKACFKCGLKGHLIKSCKKGETKAQGAVSALVSSEKKKIETVNAEKEREKENQNIVQGIAKSLAKVLASADNTKLVKDTESGECSDSDSIMSEDISGMGSGTERVVEKRPLDDSMTMGSFQTSSPVNHKKKKKKQKNYR